MARKRDDFQPSKPQSRAETTTEVAKSFIQEETAMRDKKTRRLRAVWIDKEAAKIEAEAPKPKQRKSRIKIKT